MREHIYRTLFAGLTHDEYLDEPDDVVTMQVAIKGLYDKHANRDQ